MGIRSAIAHTRHHLKNEGLSETVRWFLRRAQWRWHERRFGIHTEGVIARDELGIESSEWGEYVPTDYTDFAKIMAALRLADFTTHVFVDYGAGMGRAMVLAARYPFKRVCGVEFSPELVFIANRNIEKARPKLKCRDIELTVGDATRYELPEGTSILYLNNSFSGLTLETVLGKIRATIERTGSPIIFISNARRDSESRRQLGAQDGWLEHRTSFDLNDGRICDLFRSQPPIAPMREAQDSG